MAKLWGGEAVDGLSGHRQADADEAASRLGAVHALQRLKGRLPGSSSLYYTSHKFCWRDVGLLGSGLKVTSDVVYLTAMPPSLGP
jgi:hypothetical protein